LKTERLSQKHSFLPSEQPGESPEKDKEDPKEQEKHQMHAAILAGERVSGKEL
jgi:hypothetical protein